jgi:DNA-binding CsgD family transcriptional regulator
LTNQPRNPDSWLLSIVEDIYDSTFEPGLTKQTLSRIAEFTGAQAAALVVKDATGSFQCSRSVGISAPYTKSYLDIYGRFDPAHAIRLFDTGGLHSTDDWLPLEEFHKTRFYNEWSRPQRLQDAACVLLDKSADGFAYIGMATNKPVDDRLRRRLTPIIPHLMRAVLIGQVLEQQARITSPIEHTLDELKAATFLLNGAGHITHINESGRDILCRNDFLRIERGRLAATDPKLNRILRDAIAAAVLGDAATQSESMTLPFVAQNGEHFVGHILPLTAGRRRKTGVAYDATAVLFVSRASLDAPAAADIVKKVFKLTPAELRVLLAVVEFGGVSDTARNLDVAESTVKTHLGRIFAKTDTRRQAELVKLVAAFSSPLRS